MAVVQHPVCEMINFIFIQLHQFGESRSIPASGELGEPGVHMIHRSTSTPNVASSELQVRSDCSGRRRSFRVHYSCQYAQHTKPLYPLYSLMQKKIHRHGRSCRRRGPVHEKPHFRHNHQYGGQVAKFQPATDNDRAYRTVIQIHGNSSTSPVTHQASSKRSILYGTQHRKAGWHDGIKLPALSYVISK